MTKMLKVVTAVLLSGLLFFAPAQAAEALKVLGQLNPSATTATTLYTVPGSTSTVVSSIVVTNQAASAGTFRIAIRVAGAGLGATQYIAYDTAIPANDTIVLTLGITLAATDVVTVYASSATMSFNIFGSEIS
jgi:glucose-6-phosphate dehydrogenase assembly protein OpcA